MDFNIPQGDSQIFHFDVHPEPPAGGNAQDWKVNCTSEGYEGPVTSFDITFSNLSTPSERQRESLILVFHIADDVQVGNLTWRFAEGGVIYCDEQDDFLDRINFSSSVNGNVLTATIQCLTNQSEPFAFCFLALCKNDTSGECQIYASADPGGSINRPE